MIYQKRNKKYALILLIVSPIIGLVYGLRNLDRKGKHSVLILFGLFYGLLLTYSEGNDAGAYARLVESYYYLGWDTFVERLIGILTLSPEDETPSDLYIHILCGIAGSIFTSTSLLFALVGTVYGYFYGSALLKVIDFSNSKLKKISFLTFMLILLFVIHRSFDSMQTVRSWTGMWILFNGVFGYHKTKNKKYLLLIMVSPFFHLMYGFIALPAILAIAFRFLPKYLFVGIYTISFIFNVNSLLIVDAASDNEFTKNKLSSYYRVDKDGGTIDPIAMRDGSNKVWYAKYGKTTSVYTGATFFMIFLILGGYYSKKIMNNVEYGLMTTALLMATLANFLSFAFALYSRTMANASVYILALMVLLVLRGIFKKRRGINYGTLGIWIGIIIFIPKIVYFSSDILYKTSMLLFVFPLINLFDTSLNFSIRDTINLFIN
jgi:hypothetical protein